MKKLILLINLILLLPLTSCSLEHKHKFRKGECSCGLSEVALSSSYEQMVYYMSLDTINPWCTDQINVYNLFQISHSSFYRQIEDNITLENAKSMPVTINPFHDGEGNPTEYGSTFRFEVKVNYELKYNTNSVYFAPFKGREVRLEDYLTILKEVRNIENVDAINIEKFKYGLQIKGLYEYLEAIVLKKPLTIIEQLYEQVQYKVFELNGKSYIEVEMTEVCVPKDILPVLNNIYFTPIPVDFIYSIGGIEYYGNFKVEGKIFKKTIYTPIDTSLSTTGLVLSFWKEGQDIVFDNLTKYDYDYQGIHVSKFGQEK